MRTLVAAGLFLTGAIAMTTAVADAQEKKAEKESISIRRWIPSEKKFLNPNETKGAREDRKSGTIWKIRNDEKGFLTPEPGSEITDESGTVWVVKGVSGGVDAFTRIQVEKKDPPKKE
ncbi:hypothetical protein [Gemmata sp.]|uniref:hypothetical protein n=1 Tax=Gemmata sp. TaxID=1914242 RepID=UPI003F6F8F4F